MAKRKNAGIKKNQDSRYEIDHIILINGKRAHIRGSGYESIQEAKAALPNLIEAKKKGLETDPYKSFSSLCEEFEDSRSTQIKEQTLESLHYTMGKHIVPFFSGKDIREALTYGNMSKWYRSKATSTKDSSSRKNIIFSIMRQIIDFAWKRHYIGSDAHQDLMSLIEDVRVPNQAKTEKAVWKLETEKAFLDAIPKESDDRLMFSLFCYLGCRIAEFLALQWKCFDEERGLIKIGQQVIQTARGRVITEELKTNESYRVNQLSDELTEALKERKAKYKAKDNDDFIFPSPYSVREPLSKTEFRRRFYKYIEKAGVPRIVPHGVRHSKATMLASVCLNAEEIAVGAKFLGHSPTMFMETYVSKNGVSQSDLIKRLDKGENQKR